MVRTLAFKLTLAFLLVSLVGVALVALSSRLITEREFDRLAELQARSNFIDEVTNYYQIAGSLQGVSRQFAPGNRWPPPPPKPDNGSRGGEKGLPPPPPPQEAPIRFGLADARGKVVVPAGGFNPNQPVPADILARGTPLEIEGKLIGTVLPMDLSLSRNPLEAQYFARTNRALFIAALGAIAIALILGILFARTFSRPLREITVATKAMAGGNLRQQVPVRSQDELGLLAESFNQMSRDLDQANQLRRQMTADIAHDLRTPLSVITGYIEALRDGDLQPTPERFETMYDEAQQLKRLVDDLRTLSLADAGELPLNRQAVSIAAILSRGAAAHRHQAEQQQIVLDQAVSDTLPDISADPERLVQVLGNLVSNALRFTPEGGKISLSAQSRGSDILIEVKDTGQGIPADELPHIFNRFYRVDKSRRQTGGESGLGLAIAKAIVHAHGGTISAKSEVGRGTTFQILLPVEPVREG